MNLEVRNEAQKAFRRNLMMVATSVVVGFGFVLIAPASDPAFAQVSDRGDGSKQIDFCSGVAGASCYEVEIKNVSSATVMSTDFDQNSTDGACTKTSIKVKARDTGNNAKQNGDVPPYIYANLNSKCAYEVKYNVTDGCIGDTRARIKVNKKPKRVMLDKDCGTLKTIKKY
ncbi:MAG: hypothetical protein AAFW60_06330 [Pseudomonadota bacterium]